MIFNCEGTLVKMIKADIETGRVVVREDASGDEYDLFMSELNATDGINEIYRTMKEVDRSQN